MAPYPILWLPTYSNTKFAAAEKWLRSAVPLPEYYIGIQVINDLKICDSYHVRKSVINQFSLDFHFLAATW